MRRLWWWRSLSFIDSMTDSLNDYDFHADAPTFYEVLQAARDAGLVGEADTVLTVVLSMIRGHLVVMTGPARAGKDQVVDAAESVFNTENMVYKWPVDDSETAAYYKRNTINQYPIHRFPDLARIEDHHEKILKAFGEGRDAVRNRTDIAKADGEAMGEAVEDQVLTCPHTVIAFIASDNEQIDLDQYPELRNRALLLSVDASEEQTRRVNRRKAEERAGMTSNNIDPIRRAQIQDYHESIPVDEWSSNPNNQIRNPMGVAIHQQQPIPEKFPEARQDFDRLLEFMETVTLYHYVNRLVVERNGTKMMLVAPTDVWEAMTILGNKMVMSALNLQREDRAILRLLENSSANLTKADIQQSLRSHGFNITDSDVARSLDSMRMKGYVRVHQGNPNTFSLNEFAQVTRHDAGLDYGGLVDTAREHIYDLLDDDKADLYVDRFCEGNGLLTTHPITGEAVDITQVDELENMMDDGIEDVAGVFDDAKDGMTSDDEDDNGPDQSQGTLL